MQTLVETPVRPDDPLAQAIDACLSLVVICTTCAEICGPEEGPGGAFMRACLDCAESCSAAAVSAQRREDGSEAVVRAELEACIAACRAVVAHCESHGSSDGPCQVCAEECRRCLARCEAAVESLA